MRRVLFLAVSMIFAGFFAEAQNNSLGKSDPEAAAILKKVTSKYKSYRSFSSDFSLSMLNGQGKKLADKNGTLEIKGDKYYLEMDGDASFSDGKSIYNYDKAAREVQITSVNPNDNTLSPQKLFTDFYEKNFLYKLNEEVKKGGKTIQILELTPVDKTLPYFKVLLEVNKATSQIVGSTVFEKNGNKYIYSISSYKLNIAMADSKFSFKQSDYPGAEVVDLR